MLRCMNSFAKNYLIKLSASVSKDDAVAFSKSVGLYFSDNQISDKVCLYKSKQQTRQHSTIKSWNV